MRARSVAVYLCLIISLTTLFGHKPADIGDDLLAKITNYYSENISFGLYVHTDKNIYVPGETMWFKAYITGDTTLNNEVLYVRLVDQGNQPVMKKQFEMYDVRSHGDINLPDDLAEGKYRLYAYTDKMINFSPKEVFSRDITVVDNSANVLNATAFLADTAALSQGKDVDVVCKLSLDGISIADGKCNYTLSDTSDNVLFKGNTKTNNFGGAAFSLPAKHLNTNLPLILNIAFKKNKAQTQLRYILPKHNEYFHVTTKADAEGCLVGIPCNIRLHAADLNNTPVNAKIRFIRNNAGLQTIASANGDALLTFTPAPIDTVKNGYNISVEHHGRKQNFPLQLKIKSAGYVMELLNNNGQYQAVIHKKNTPNQVAIVLRNERDIIWSKMLDFASHDSLTIPVPTANIYGQALSLALFTNDGKLIAERQFTDQAKNVNPLKIELSKVNKQGKTFMRIKLSSKYGQAKASGCNFSVSVVARQVIDTTAYTPIFATFGAPKQGGLIHSWNRILNYNPTGKRRIYANTAGVWGIVKHINNKKPIKVKQLLLKNSNGFNTIPLDLSGQFSIPADLLINPDGSRNNLFLENKNKGDYYIEIKDYAALFDQQISGSFYDVMPANTIGYDITKPAMEKLRGAVPLKVVNINAKNRLSWEERVARARANYPDCDDYVCQYNILNCRNHKPSEALTTSPVIGESYLYKGNMLTTYLGCLIPAQAKNPTNVVLKNISIPLEFDKENVDGFGTTIYWSPNIYNDVNGEAYLEVPVPVEQYKEYRVMVEGITGNLVPLFATQTISWKNSK